MQAARGASLSSSDTVQDHPSRRRPRALLLFASVALVAYALDLGSKQWALAELADGDIAVLGDWFVLHLTFNPGAAFSTGTDFTMLAVADPGFTRASLVLFETCWDRAATLTQWNTSQNG